MDEQLRMLDWLAWMIEQGQVEFELRRTDGSTEVWRVYQMVATGGPIRLIQDQRKLAADWYHEREAGGDG